MTVTTAIVLPLLIGVIEDVIAIGGAFQIVGVWL